jgi:hypothetical protein
MFLLKCDLAQSIGSVIASALDRIPDHPARTNWTHFSLSLFERPLSNTDPVSSLFDNFPITKIPTLVLHRELPPVKVTADTLVFKTTALHALAKCQSDTIPYFMTSLMARISTKIDQEGIYRKSGLQTKIDAITAFIDSYTDPAVLDSYLDEQQGHEMACVLKLWFRNLSEQLIPNCFADEIRAALALEPPIHQARALKLCVHSLPTPHYNILKAFSEHIAFVLTGNNEMSINAMSICIGPTLFKSLPGANVIADTALFQAFVKHLFENWRFIFLNEPWPDEVYVRAKTNLTIKGTQIVKGQIFVATDPEAMKIVTGGATVPVDAANFEIIHDLLPSAFGLFNIVEGQAPAGSGVTYLEPGIGVVTDALKQSVQQRVENLREMKEQIRELGAKIRDDPEDAESKATLAKLRQRFLKL